MHGIVLSCSDKKKDKPLVDHSALVKRKKEHQSYELDEEGELAAQKRKISTCCLVHFAQRLCSTLMLVPCFSLELAIRHEIPPLSFFVAGSHQLYISDRKDYL